MTITITTTTGPAVTTITTAPVYRQCGGTGWNGTCSSCGSYMTTSGVCLALVEIITTPQKKHAECPCCECPE